MNTGSNLKSIRGGSWARKPEQCRPTNRATVAIDFMQDTLGFRCVYNP